MTNQTKSPKFSPEVRERAVRMVLDYAGDYPSQWAAIASIAAKIGCTAQTLSNWVKQAERDSGKRAGLTAGDRERLKQLERENKELRQANEILRKASAYFAQAELDRRSKTSRGSSTSTGQRTGSSRFASNCRSPRRPTMSTMSAAGSPSGFRRVPSAMPPSCWRSNACSTITTKSTACARCGTS
jgi:transposase-like protein